MINTTTCLRFKVIKFVRVIVPIVSGITLNRMPRLSMPVTTSMCPKELVRRWYFAVFTVGIAEGVGIETFVGGVSIVTAIVTLFPRGTVAGDVGDVGNFALSTCKCGWGSRIGRRRRFGGCVRFATLRQDPARYTWLFFVMKPGHGEVNGRSSSLS